MLFLALTDTKNTKSEKTNKHIIEQISQKKLFEHIFKFIKHIQIKSYNYGIRTQKIVLTLNTQPHQK